MTVAFLCLIAAHPVASVQTQDECEGNSVLARTARKMQAGEFKKLPADNTINDLDVDGHLVSWTDTGVWNPVDRTVQWVGSPGSCCADPASYRLLSYDTQSNRWSVDETPWKDASGHAYDCNALDPGTGHHYFNMWKGDLRAYDGEEWKKIPGLPINPKVANALTWFRSYNDGKGALIFVARNSVALYDGKHWKDVSPSGIEGWGKYHFFAEYNPVHDLVWLGGGNDGTRKHACLNANLEYVQLKEAPVNLNAQRSMKTYDPITGEFIVCEPGEKQDSWYVYHIRNDRWTDISDSMQNILPDAWNNRKKGRSFVTPIDGCGVLLYANQYAGTFLYKHADSK